MIVRSLAVKHDFIFRSSKKITGEGIQVDVCVESFPRGGQQTLTPLEKSIIRSQAKQDVLFTEVSQ